MRLPGAGGVASLSLDRLLQDRVPIDWKEAVAVVHAADSRSADTGIPLTLTHCRITTSGDVCLDHAAEAPRLSSLQLLAALLEGQASATDLRVLAVTADHGADCQDDARLYVDVRWCLGPDPAADIARLARRGLGDVDPGLVRPAAEATAGTATASAGQQEPRDRTAPGIVGLRIRVARVSPGVALAMVAVFLAAAGSAALAGAMLGPNRAAPADAVPAHNVPASPGGAQRTGIVAAAAR